MRTKDLVDFIIARERVRRRKEEGAVRPWTKDPILDRFRFCNVHRENDAVTRWIGKHVREPNRIEEDLWFMLVVVRLFNQPSTLAHLMDAGCILPFKPELMRRRLHALENMGERIFNAAYIVSTNGRAMNKVDYLVQFVLGPLWASRKRLRPGLGMTLANYHRTLMQMDGLGSFMAAQVIADLKYVAPLKDAEDWHTWAAPGPGSKRGLNRVMNRHPDQSWPGRSWNEALGTLHMAVEAMLAKQDAAILPLHAQDLQNCLCEFDKYERARLGEGTPKQIYKEKV